MNVGQLKAILADLPDDMLVGNAGHFGELLDCNDVKVRKDVTIGNWRTSTKKETILCISIEDAGPDPD